MALNIEPSRVSLCEISLRAGRHSTRYAFDAVGYEIPRALTSLLGRQLRVDAKTIEVIISEDRARLNLKEVDKSELRLTIEDWKKHFHAAKILKEGRGFVNIRYLHKPIADIALSQPLLGGPPLMAIENSISTCDRLLRLLDVAGRRSSAKITYGHIVKSYSQVELLAKVLLGDDVREEPHIDFDFEGLDGIPDPGPGLFTSFIA